MLQSLVVRLGVDPGAVDPARPYRITRTYPGNLNEDDLRASVTFETPELQLPLRFYFLRLKDEKDGRLEYKYQGHTFETGPVSRDSMSGVDLDDVGPTPEQARWVKENLNTYRRMAECAVAGDPFDDAPVWAIYRHLRAKTLSNRVQGKPWSDEELIIVAQTVIGGERLGLTRNEIAAELGIGDRSTLYRAYEKARARGLVDDAT